MNTHSGVLVPPNGDEGSSEDFKLSAVALFKGGKIKEARELICSNVRDDDMEDMFKWMYDNLDLFASDDAGKDKAILAIRDGLVNHSLVADPEINLSATLVELTS